MASFGAPVASDLDHKVVFATSTNVCLIGAKVEVTARFLDEWCAAVFTRP